ncbi:GGDEF domain-containing protein [Vibrio rhodolitus]|uniref:GGDEF domain-containing protein n=1 Tax=Vibrio rhodolitus TaxID=2231649 RepID=UPI000E0A567E|nr:GGDEF domain-containing protein [Vibrio rhodolitus]
MALHYTKVSTSSATVEIRSLLLMLVVVFAVNTPIGMIKNERVDTLAKQLYVVEETYKLRKSLVSSYLSLSDSTIAKHYFTNPHLFTDTVAHLMQEQSLLSSITIVSTQPAKRFRYSQHIQFYNEFYHNLSNRDMTQSVFRPDLDLFTEIAPIFDADHLVGYLVIEVNLSKFSENMRDNMVMLSSDGYVYSSTKPGINAFESLPMQYSGLVEQIERIQRASGKIEVGDYTGVYRRSISVNNQTTYLIKLVADDELIPRYIYLVMVLSALTIGVSYFLYKTRRDKQELSKITYVDELSGLHNRHYLNKLLNSSLNPNQYYVGIFDIDHFKSVNDKFGHDIGDQVIKRVAGVIRSRIRFSDYAFRMGGEEFLVVIKTDSTDVAKRIFERIRRDIETIDSQPKVTVSAGVCPLSCNLAQAIKLADTRLYSAKNQGRNQVCTE